MRTTWNTFSTFLKNTATVLKPKIEPPSFPRRPFVFFTALWGTGEARLEWLPDPLDQLLKTTPALMSWSKTIKGNRNKDSRSGFCHYLSPNSEIKADPLRLEKGSWCLLFLLNSYREPLKKFRTPTRWIRSFAVTINGASFLLYYNEQASIRVELLEIFDLAQVGVYLPEGSKTNITAQNICFKNDQIRETGQKALSLRAG